MLMEEDEFQVAGSVGPIGSKVMVGSERYLTCTVVVPTAEMKPTKEDPALTISHIEDRIIPPAEVTGREISVYVPIADVVPKSQKAVK